MGSFRGAFVALYLSLPATAGFAAEAVQLAATVCAACHGVDGNSTDPAYPKLAGMDQEYMLRQLKAFAGGKRRDETMTGARVIHSAADDRHS